MLVVFHGQFGEAVARNLDPKGSGSCTLASFLGRTDQQLDPRASLLVSGVPAYDAFRRFARRMETSGNTWTLGYLNGSRAFCGPTFGPSPGPCFDCYFQRTLSHTGSIALAEQEIALGQFYSSDLERGHPGYAGTAVQVMADSFRKALAAPEPGRLLRLDLLELEVTPGRIIPVHGCPRCRPFSAGSRRFTQHLHRQLQDG